jgi:hypothetical protein
MRRVPIKALAAERDRRRAAEARAAELELVVQAGDARLAELFSRLPAPAQIILPSPVPSPAPDPWCGLSLKQIAAMPDAEWAMRRGVTL